MQVILFARVQNICAHWDEQVKKALHFLVKMIIAYGAKFLSADWLRQRACFHNHDGTFGNQEGMIT